MTNCRYIDLSNLESNIFSLEIDSPHLQQIIFYNSKPLPINLVTEEQRLLSKLISLNADNKKVQETHQNKTIELALNINSKAKLVFYLLNPNFNLNLTCNSFSNAKADISFWLHQMNSKTTIQTTQNIVADNTSSNLKIQSVLDEGSDLSFDGLIDVKENVLASSSSWYHHALKLKPKVKVKSKPSLRIKSQKVKVDHGLAITSLSSNTLNYMISRGLDVESAKCLEIVAKFNQFKQFLPTICF